MFSFFGILLAGVISLPQDAPTLPIFQPGAPGSGARTITPAQAVDLSRTSFTPGDVQFMQHMLVHHGQAVEMVALLQAHGDSPQIKRLGQRITLSQEAEMALMRDWLTDRGQPLAMAMTDSHAGHGMHHAMPMASSADDVAPMPGMLTPNQMKALAAARGADFDRLFLAGMIQHHQGALGMVETLMAQANAAQDPMLSDFATSVVADQSAEILRMQSLLSDL